MEEAVMGKQSLSLAQKNMMDYWQNHDLKYVAEDAVFKNISTGEEYRGRTEIGAFLHYIYQVAFDAKADVKNFAVTEDKAMFDGYFKGRHIGEYAGIQATQKEVNVPLCVSYSLKNGLITEARIFLLTEIMRQQLGAPDAKQKTTFVTRDIFKLKFGHFKEVKALMETAMKNEIMPDGKMQRVLTDFTGEAYRLILEEGFDSLADYEKSLTSGMRKDEFQQWYNQFKPHVESSYREILKQVY